MNFSVVRKVNLIPVLLLLFFVLYSCKEDKHSVHLLTEAQSMAESNPKLALNLLDSIRNPENMGKDNYMQYVVTRVQLKFKNQQDITGDTLIFESKKYFETKNNADKTALTQFYAGLLYREQKIDSKALECFLQAKRSAEPTGNNLLIGRSFHNIGNIYFVWNMPDSAIVNYGQALHWYGKAKGSEINTLTAINLMGRAYNEKNNSDSAFFYFSKGLDLAKQLNNKPQQTTFTHLLGIVLRNQGEYGKAKGYFQKALTETQNPEESVRICYGLAQLYTVTNQPDSAQYYVTRLEAGLPKINDNYVLKSMYGFLSDHYKLGENYKKALYYGDLQRETAQRIAENDNSQKLLTAEKKYSLSLKEKELASLRMRSYLCITIGLSAVLILLVVGYFITKNERLKHEKEEERNKTLQAQNELLDHKIESLTFLQNIYHNILNDWTAIDKEVKKLAAEYGATQEPPLFLKIRKMVENIKTKANQQFIERAKDLLLREPSGKKAIAMLNDKDLLFLILCHCKYNTRDTAAILGRVPSKQNFDMKRLSLRNKLIEAGLPPLNINLLLRLEGDDVLQTAS